MAYTVNTIVSAVQRRLPDVPSATIITLVNQIHREILSEIPEARMDSVTVNLTSGTQEYNVTEPVFQVLNAYYKTGANASTALTAISIEELNGTRPTWRTDATGTPTYFYLTSNQSSGNAEYIGLYPCPNTTTSSGYPVVVMDVSKLESSDLVGSDTVLITLHSSQVYVEGASFLAAAEVRPQVAGAYRAEYMHQLDLAKDYVRSRNETLKNPGIHNIRGGSYADRDDRPSVRK